MREKMGWEKWNFRMNPFEPQPLESREELQNLFVGREQELRKAKGILASPGSRIVVEADAGVGKTTFVNKIFSELTEEHPDILVVPKTIKLESYLGAEAKWKISTALAAVLKDLKAEKKWKGRIKHLVAEARKLEIEGVSIGLGFIPGIALKRRDEIPTGPVSHLAEEVKTSVETLLPKLGYRCALVALNNLDALPDEHRKSTLNEIRDFLYSKTISFILLADDGFYEKAQSDLPRWRGFLSIDPVALPPFSSDDMVEIIEKRLTFYSMPTKEAVNPIAEDLIEFLCETSAGNLRWTLSTLGTLASTLLERPSTEDVMTTEMALPTLRAKAQLRLIRLTGAEQKLILKLTEYGRESFSTDKKFQDMTGYPQARLSQLFNSLHRAGHLVKNYKVRKAYYSPAPDYRLLNGR